MVCWPTFSTPGTTNSPPLIGDSAIGSTASVRLQSLSSYVKKNYLLDTNVLLHDPNSLVSFQDNNVLIPIEVIEEIDRFKRESSELGRNARAVSRMIDGWRTQGHLSDGIRLPDGGTFRIVFDKPVTNSTNGAHSSADNRILARALSVRSAEPDMPLVIVTKDINLRL